MRRWIILGVLAALVASLCWGPRSWRPQGPSGHAQVGYQVVVRGRLVDGATAQPLAGRGVFALTYDAQATATETLEGFAWRNVAVRAAQAGGAAVDEQSPRTIFVFRDQHTLSGADGRFQVKLVVTNCVPIVDGEPAASPYPAEREGLHGLLVESPGAAPLVIAPAPHGTWQRAPKVPGSDDVRDAWAVWDLGDVRVPTPK